MIKKGDYIKCHWPTTGLTDGKVYQAVEDQQPGIFDTPYVTVINDDGDAVTCHTTRFGKPGTDRPAWPTEP